jgi:hypothetical protein
MMASSHCTTPKTPCRGACYLAALFLATMLSKAARRTGQRLAPEAIAFRDAGATRDINLKGEDATKV